MGTLSRYRAVERRPHDIHEVASHRANGSATAAHEVAPFLTVCEWRGGEPRRELSPRPLRREPANGSGASVISVEVEFGAETDEVLRALQRICDPQITRPMVEDLLDTDDLPKVFEWPGTGIRSVSGVAVRGTADDDPIRGGLEFDVVELLAGPDWIVVSCHT